MLFFNEAFLDIFNLFYLVLQSSHIPSFILQLLAELLMSYQLTLFIAKSFLELLTEIMGKRLLRFEFYQQLFMELLLRYQLTLLVAQRFLQLLSDKRLGRLIVWFFVLDEST